MFTNHNTTVWRRGIRTHATEKSPYASQQFGDEDSNTRSNKIRSPTTAGRRRFEHTQLQNLFTYNSLATKIRTHAATKSVHLQLLGDEDSNTRSYKICSPTTVWRRRFEHAATKFHSPCNSLATRNRTQHTKILSSHSTSLKTNCEFKHGEKRKTIDD